MSGLETVARRACAIDASAIKRHSVPARFGLRGPRPLACALEEAPLLCDAEAVRASASRTRRVVERGSAFGRPVAVVPESEDPFDLLIEEREEIGTQAVVARSRLDRVDRRGDRTMPSEGREVMGDGGARDAVLGRDHLGQRPRRVLADREDLDETPTDRVGEQGEWMGGMRRRRHARSVASRVIR